jgi:hypothetical protein
MRGSNDRRAALAALALGVIVTTGAAAAAPVDVLRATDGRRECIAPLAEGATFHYRYIQSMYEKPVVEDLERRGGRIAVLRIHSTELRAVEYYRWDTPIRADGDGFVQEAPPYSTDRLTIRVSPPYAQRVDGPAWACDLEALFPDQVVRVDAETRPAALTLIR